MGWQLCACRVVWGRVLLALGVLAAATGVAEPLLPPKATVLLLVGLSGDIETENSYHSQLQSWIEIVAGTGQAKKLYVLCDDPDSLSLPRQPESKALKGDRNSFLKLAETLAGATNPVLVIAWGHGGK